MKERKKGADQPPWEEPCPKCGGAFGAGGGRLSMGGKAFMSCDNGHWFQLLRGLQLKQIDGPPRLST